MSENDEVLKYPTDVSSIDDAHAVIKWAGIESTEYTDCAILYEVTFDQLRLMYDMGRQKESKLRAIDRTEIDCLKNAIKILEENALSAERIEANLQACNKSLRAENKELRREITWRIED